MSERPPFDQRAALLIILIYMGVCALVIAGGVGGCLVYARSIVEGTYKCDPEGRLFDLAAALGTLAGLAAGYLMRNK